MNEGLVGAGIVLAVALLTRRERGTLAGLPDLDATVAAFVRARRLPVDDADAAFDRCVPWARAAIRHLRARGWDAQHVQLAGWRGALPADLHPKWRTLATRYGAAAPGSFSHHVAQVGERVVDLASAQFGAKYHAGGLVRDARSVKQQWTNLYVIEE